MLLEKCNYQWKFNDSTKLVRFTGHSYLLFFFFCLKSARLRGMIHFMIARTLITIEDLSLGSRILDNAVIENYFSNNVFLFFQHSFPTMCSTSRRILTSLLPYKYTHCSLLILKRKKWMMKQIAYNRGKFVNDLKSRCSRGHGLVQLLFYRWKVRWMGPLNLLALIFE